ncbi:MAG: hypothetical protein RLZ04_1105 [Actinomycetota bacterium]
MGTAKRERQKANRQNRLQELAQEARKQKSKRVGLRIGSLIAAIVVIVGLFSWLGGSDEAATTETTTIDTLAPAMSTLPAGEKPEVEIPAEVPTELTVTVLTEGTGEGAAAGDEIAVQYVGVLSADGTEFDSSYDAGQAFTFVLGTGAVIEGWDEGLLGAKLGSRIQLDIPADLAYGDQSAGDVITPGSALTFVVDVVGLTKAETPETTAPATETTGTPTS